MDKKAKSMDKKDLISLDESASLSPEPKKTVSEQREKGTLSVYKEYLTRVKAFYELSVLCDEWNKQDGFIPDYDDKDQEKWYPIFSISGSGFSYSLSTATAAYVLLGSRFCFKSKQRSNEFGKKFEDLAEMFFRG